MSGRVPPSKRVAMRERYGSEFERAARRYEDFTGHVAEPRAVFDFRVPPVAAAIGECDGVLYTTVRDGQRESYIHKFRKGSKPFLCVSPDGKLLLLVGGSFTFTERGIVDD